MPRVAAPPLVTVEFETLATRACLGPLLARTDETAAHAGLRAADASDLRLAVEEACRNVIDHGYPPDPPGPLRLAIAVHADRVVVTLADEARPFAPDDAPRPDLTADWRQMRIGGLGWHLIRLVMDAVTHELPPGGGNRLVLVKRLRSSN